MSLRKYLLQCDDCDEQFFALLAEDSDAEPNCCVICGSSSVKEVKEEEEGE